MEAAPTNETKSENSNTTSNLGAPQPQRDRKVQRGRNEKKEKPKQYYKTDIVHEEESSEPNSTSSEQLEQFPQEKLQRRQNGQGQQGYRVEKVYQPKANQNSNSTGDTNGESQSPKDYAQQKRNQRGKQQNQESGFKKSYQKKNKEPETQKDVDSVGNERFNNSPSIDGGQDYVKDPHRALQVAEASRLQQIVPSGVPVEIQEKVKRIQEIVGKDVEFHLIYGALEDLGYDEDKTVDYFLEGMEGLSRGESNRKSKKQPQRETNLPSGLNWTNIVKKGIKEPYPHESSVKPQRSSNSQFPSRSPVMDSLMNGTPLDPEDLVVNLSVAITNQLKMIQEQTKMLTLMQNELASITQVGSSERQQLLNEKERLKEREAELHAELEDIHHRMTEVEQALEENKKKKAERINSITSNNLVASLLKKPVAGQPGPQQQSKPNNQAPREQQDQGRPREQQDQGRPREQQDQGRPREQQDQGRPREQQDQGRPQARQQRDGRYQQRRNYQQRDERN